FCTACIAPLRVVPLAALADDLDQSLTDLLETLADGRRTAPESPELADCALLRAYVSAFWLRPETALIQFAEAQVVAPLLAAADGPVLDVGCGDGIHASLLHGWRFG